MQLAEELGARTRTLAGRSIHEAVLGYAHKHNVSKIVVGKPIRPRWREALSGSVVDRLIYAAVTSTFTSSVHNPIQSNRLCLPNGVRTARLGVTCLAWGWWPWPRCSSCRAGEPGACQPGDALPGQHSGCSSLSRARAGAADIHPERAGF